MKQEKIIKNTVNSLYMKNIASKKGWSKQYAAYKVSEFLTCGEKISLFKFMKRN